MKRPHLLDIPFQACGILLAVRCNRRLERAVSEVVGPFRVPGPGRYTLQISVDPSLGDPHNLKCKRWEGREMHLQIPAAGKEPVAAAVGCLVAASLGENGGLLLHGACLMCEGRAHVFLGRPGAGKSTLARNASRVACIHDDKVAVRCVDGRWKAFGVPLLDNAGTTGPNIEAPLGGVYLIEKSDRLKKEPVSRKEALVEMPAHVVLPISDPESRTAVFETLFSLIEGATLRRLFFSKDADVAGVI